MGKRLNVDATLCTGCRYCEAVCSLVHEKEVNPKKARIRVKSDILRGIDVPIVCHQCTDPPCMKVCPTGAIKVHTELQISIVDVERCAGCKKCIEACPYNAIFFDDNRKIALKCDLCGGDPQCIKFCRKLPFFEKAALSLL